MRAGSGTAKRTICLLLAASAACGLAPAVASANTVVIGSTPLASTPGFAVISVGANVPVFQGDASGSYTLSSPVSGTIVSWGFMSAGIANGQSFALRVLRPADSTGTNWTAVATSPVQQVTGGGPGLDVQQGPFTTGVSIPVQAGDRIGLQATGGPDVPTEQGVANQDGVRYFSTPFADGTTAAIAPGSSADNAQVVPVQATIQYSPAPPPPLSPPGNSVLPAISGAATVGQFVSCSTGSWTNNPTSFTYQWQLDNAPISGETGQSHLITAAEAGHQLTCRVTATNSGGSAAAVSGAVVPSMVASPPVVNLRVDRGTGMPGSALLLDASGSSAAGSAIRNYRFSFGATGSAQCSASKPVIAAVFSGPGHLTATVVATAADGASAAATTQLTISSRSAVRGTASAVRGTALASYACGATASSLTHPVTGITHNQVQCGAPVEVSAGLGDILGCYAETTDPSQVPRAEGVVIDGYRAADRYISVPVGGGHVLAGTDVPGRAANTRLTPSVDTFYIFQGTIEINGVVIDPKSGDNIVLAVGGLDGSAFVNHSIDLLVGANVSASLKGPGSLALPLTLPSAGDDAQGVDGQNPLAVIPDKDVTADKRLLPETPITLDISDFDASSNRRKTTSLGVPIGSFSITSFLPLPIPELRALIAYGRAPVYLYTDDQGDAASRIVLDLRLPDLRSSFDGGPDVTTEWDLVTDNSRQLHVDSADLDLANVSTAYFGPIELDNLDFRYSADVDNGTLTTNANVSSLSLFEGSVGVTVELGDLQGRGAVNKLSVDYTASLGQGVPVIPDQISLTHAEVSLDLTHNFKLSGDLTLSILQSVGHGCGVAGWDGSGSLSFGPFSLDGDGHDQFACVDLGSGEHFHIDQDGNLTFGRTVDFSLPHVASVHGGLDASLAPELSNAPALPHFQLEGDESVSLDAFFGLSGSGTVALSDRGIGFCVDGPFGWRPGFGTEYNPGAFFGYIGDQVFLGGVLPPVAIAAYLIANVDVQTNKCNIDHYTSIASASDARGATTQQAFTIPPGQPRTAITITGSGGAPAVMLNGPRGRTINATTTTPLITSTQFAAQAPTLDLTEIQIGGNDSGRWTITPIPGSPAITSTTVGRLEPNPTITGSVKGDQARRLLHFSAHMPDGMTLTFIDHAPDGTTHQIGTSHRATGTLAFTPTAIRPGTHTIFAQITNSSGTIMPELKVASYRASPVKLGRARVIRVSLSRGTLRITVRSGANATSSVLGLLLSNGRTYSTTLHGTQPTITIGHLPAGVYPTTIAIRTIGATATGPMTESHLKRPRTR